VRKRALFKLSCKHNVEYQTEQTQFSKECEGLVVKKEGQRLVYIALTDGGEARFVRLGGNRVM